MTKREDRHEYKFPKERELAPLSSLVPSIPRKSRLDRLLWLEFAGRKELLTKPIVSVIGSRVATADGIKRASRLAKELVKGGAVVMSGLAAGIDTAAHMAAIENDGDTIGVIGTRITEAYPLQNAELQESIWRRFLLIAAYGKGGTNASHFPRRNRLMAALSDATVIVEATDESGTLHQARECMALGRPLFIMRSILGGVYNWPSSFMRVTGPSAIALDKTEQILEAIKNDGERRPFLRAC